MGNKEGKEEKVDETPATAEKVDQVSPAETPIDEEAGKLFSNKWQHLSQFLRKTTTWVNGKKSPNLYRTISNGTTPEASPMWEHSRWKGCSCSFARKNSWSWKRIKFWTCCVYSVSKKSFFFSPFKLLVFFPLFFSLWKQKKSCPFFLLCRVCWILNLDLLELFLWDLLIMEKLFYYLQWLEKQTQVIFLFFIYFSVVGSFFSVLMLSFSGKMYSVFQFQIQFPCSVSDLPFSCILLNFVFQKRFKQKQQDGILYQVLLKY